MNTRLNRKLLLIISMLLFPVTLYYFSPALIIFAGFNGIINGSFIIFGFLLIGSIFFGRLFCSFLCPAGGIQECLFAVNSNSTKKNWKYKVKYIIWILWIIIVLFSYIYGHGIHKVDFFYETEHGISVISFNAYIIYYVIVLIIVVPALVGGKRSFCHYFCWMAPFMMIGMKLRRLLHLPGLKVVAEQEKCVSCKKCNKVCPMSIEVETLIKHSDTINDVECIQCGECIKNCPKSALAYKVKLDSGGVFISH